MKEPPNLARRLMPVLLTSIWSPSSQIKTCLTEPMEWQLGGGPMWRYPVDRNEVPCRSNGGTYAVRPGERGRGVDRLVPRVDHFGARGAGVDTRPTVTRCPGSDANSVYVSSARLQEPRVASQLRQRRESARPGCRQITQTSRGLAIDVLDVDQVGGVDVQGLSLRASDVRLHRAPINDLAVLLECTLMICWTRWMWLGEKATPCGRSGRSRKSRRNAPRRALRRRETGSSRWWSRPTNATPSSRGRRREMSVRRPSIAEVEFESPECTTDAGSCETRAPWPRHRVRDGMNFDVETVRSALLTVVTSMNVRSLRPWLRSGGDARIRASYAERRWGVDVLHEVAQAPCGPRVVGQHDRVTRRAVR